jgi:hypothetical protein
LANNRESELDLHPYKKLHTLVQPLNGFIAREARKNHFHWLMEIGLLLPIVTMMVVMIERASILGFNGRL